MNRFIILITTGLSLNAWAIIGGHYPSFEPKATAQQNSPSEQNPECAPAYAALSRAAKKEETRKLAKLLRNFDDFEDLLAAIYRVKTAPDATEDRTQFLHRGIRNAFNRLWWNSRKTDVAIHSLPPAERVQAMEGIPISGPARKLARHFHPADPRFAAPPVLLAQTLRLYLEKRSREDIFVTYTKMTELPEAERPLWYEELLMDLGEQVPGFREPSQKETAALGLEKHAVNNAVAKLALSEVTNTPFDRRPPPKPEVSKAKLQKFQYEHLSGQIQQKYLAGMTQDEIATALYLARQTELRLLFEKVAEDTRQALALYEAKRGGGDIPKLHSPRDIDTFVRLKDKPEVVALAHELEATARGFLNPVGSPVEKTDSDKEIEKKAADAHGGSNAVLGEARYHGSFATAAHLHAASDAQRSAAHRYRDYGTELDKSVLELEFLTPMMRKVLIAQSNLLMQSGPGAAKTMSTDNALGSLVTDQGPSYFKKQLSLQTTPSDLVGNPDPRAAEIGEAKRFPKRGILGYRVAFLDEVLNAGTRVLTMLNEIMNEHKFTESGVVFDSLCEVVFGATNKSLARFRHDSRDSDDPKAVLARYPAKAIVPDEFQRSSSGMRLINGELPGPPGPFKFEDLDTLREVAKQVKISPSISIATNALFHDMKYSLQKEERESAERVKKERAKNPEAQAYQRSCLFSPRDLVNWTRLLRATVVDDWAMKNGSRDLALELRDLPATKFGVLLEGPSTAYLEKSAKNSLDPFEKADFEAAIIERKVFNDRWALMNHRIDTAVSNAKQLIAAWKAETGDPVATLAKLNKIAARGQEIEKIHMKDDEEEDPVQATFEEVGEYFAAVEVRKALAALHSAEKPEAP